MLGYIKNIKIQIKPERIQIKLSYFHVVLDALLYESVTGVRVACYVLYCDL
jgi:hypothetical protein